MTQSQIELTARPTDPKPRSIVSRAGRRHVIVKVWRTATAKHADGLLHIGLRNEAGHFWTAHGRDAESIADSLAPLAAQADKEYGSRLDAQRCTLEFAQASSRRFDAGKQSIEDGPLFGGQRQGLLF